MAQNPITHPWGKPKKKRKGFNTTGSFVQTGAGFPGAATNTGLDAVYAPTSPLQQTGPQVDPMLEAQKAAAGLNIKLGDAWDAYATGQLTTGFGNLDNPTADLASNPYSRAALLQQSYNNQRRGTTNSYASAGQLYSGALQNAQEENLRGYGQGLDALKKERQGLLDELLRDRVTRYSQTGAQLNEDTLNALLRALEIK